MSLYILPPAIDSSEIIDLAKKAGAPFEQFQSIRELILGSEGHPIIIATVKPQDLLVLNRHAATLVTELPTVIMSAPGVVYSGDWVTLASALPAVDWKEIQSKLSKSGHLAVTPEQLQARDLGAPAYDQNLSRALFARPKGQPHGVDPDDQYAEDAPPEA